MVGRNRERYVWRIVFYRLPIRIDTKPFQPFLKQHSGLLLFCSQGHSRIIRLPEAFVLVANDLPTRLTRLMRWEKRKQAPASSAPAAEDALPT
jgi:hypothetical protein